MLFRSGNPELKVERHESREERRCHMDLPRDEKLDEIEKHFRMSNIRWQLKTSQYIVGRNILTNVHTGVSEVYPASPDIRTLVFINSELQLKKRR